MEEGYRSESNPGGLLRSRLLLELSCLLAALTRFTLEAGAMFPAFLVCGLHVLLRVLHRHGTASAEREARILSPSALEGNAGTQTTP
jgi:hypothetical protein